MAHITGQLSKNLPDYKPCYVDQSIFHQTSKPSGKITVVTHKGRNGWRMEMGALQQFQQRTSPQQTGTQCDLGLSHCLSHQVRHHTEPSDGGRLPGTGMPMDCYSSRLVWKTGTQYIHYSQTKIFIRYIFRIYCNLKEHQPYLRL